MLSHRQLEVAEGSIHVVEGGEARAPGVLFLHGWPASWASFERVMRAMSDRAHVAAIDLPGIGASTATPRASDKRSLAAVARAVIAQLGMRDVTLVGHDVGGMIAYAYLRAFPGELARAVIMNVAIPGVDPWDEVKRNPAVWHWGFHAVPGLPEQLVAGREPAYFGFFYDAIAGAPGAVDDDARAIYVEAYARPQALHAGFEWYRAFARDEQDNLAVAGQPVDTPVLYLRGQRERGDLDRYLTGLRGAGLRAVRGGVIAGSGHFAPDERPDEVVAALRAFMPAR